MSTTASPVTGQYPDLTPSHWLQQMYGPDLVTLRRRSPLKGPTDCDVCVVGAGYTGLWTALELKRQAPELDVVVLEAQYAGYGAAGRNGGAVIAQLNGDREYWSRRGGGREAAVRMEQAVQQGVGEVGEALEREGIECGYGRRGVLIAARSKLEADRLKAGVTDDGNWGLPDAASRWLGAEEASSHIRIDGLHGARLSEICASVDPAKMARGLADAAERRGVRIYEQTPVSSFAPGRVVAAGAEVRCTYVLIGTEAYTSSLEGQRGRFAPIHTSMLVTEVIPDEVWAQIGWEGRETVLAEHPFLHLQHTADRRITIGGDDNRVPYKYAGATRADGAAPAHVAAMYHRELLRLFPALSSVPIAGSWQGVFATTRNWAPTVHLDRSSGMGWAGGYVGEGLTASHLAGRTMADLVLQRDTELTRLPWVDNVPRRRWQSEPASFVGSQLVWAMRYAGDRMERRTGKASPLVEAGERLAGLNGHIG